MGLKIDAKDFLTNMSAIKQRSMFAAEKVGQNAAARMEGEANHARVPCHMCIRHDEHGDGGNADLPV